MTGWWQDARYALRSFRRSPWFFAVAVLTLAVGMAAAVSMFSLLNGVLLRPLAYAHADRLVHLEGTDIARYGSAMPDLLDIRAQARSLDAVVVTQGWGYQSRNAEGLLVRRPAQSVSANYFDALGVTPLRGRFFRAGDVGSPLLVISEALWRSEYQASDDVIGRTVPVDSFSYTIVGVAPASLVDPLARNLRWPQPEAWRVHPPEFERGAGDRGWVGFWGFGRLRPGATLAAAQREVDAILAPAYPDRTERVLTLSTFRNSLVRDIRPTLIALFAAVIAIVLIGCANVANLLLSRASVRVRELAVRSSLGAPRMRLVRQLFAESLLLASTAALAGLLLGWWSLRLLSVMLADQLPQGTVLSPDLRVAAFVASLAVLTSLLFGVAPALQFTRAGTMATIREGGRGQTNSRRAALLRHGLVVAECALAVLLLAGAGLFFRTFLNLQAIDTGFATESVMTASLNLLPTDFPTNAEQTLALERVLTEMRASPDVSRAGAINDLPMSGALNSTGITPPGRETSVSTLVRTVAGDYFGTLEIPLRAGRIFDDRDLAASTPVAIVNATAVRMHFGDLDPLGRTLTVRGIERTIVGVVADVTEFSVAGEPKPVLYTPYAQEDQGWMRSAMQLVVRGTSSQAVAAAVSAGARSVRTFVREPRPLHDLVARDIAAPRFRATLLGLFAGLAVTLAAVGIGSVIAYGVSERARELGVRLALGATPSSLARFVVGQSARLAVGGVAIGVAGAVALGRLVAGFLFGVPATDLVSLLGAAALLVALALLAAAVPAIRAARIDPAVTLRAD